MWSNHFPIAFGSQHTLELTRRRESIVMPNTELLRASSPTARWMREKVPAISAVTDRPGTQRVRRVNSTGSYRWMSLNADEHTSSHLPQWAGLPVLPMRTSTASNTGAIEA